MKSVIRGQCTGCLSSCSTLLNYGDAVLSYCISQYGESENGLCIVGSDGENTRLVKQRRMFV